MEVVLTGVCKSYGGRRVLSDVSLRLARGERLCLLGPSGCGKTTLMRLIAGLEAPDSGEIRGLEGKKISAVFQEDRLFEALSAERNVLLTAEAGFGRAAARALLAELGLEADARRPVRGFSGGMRRRVALARALAARFDLLLLDEPFAGLDAQSRSLALEAIRRRLDDRALFLISHERGDAEDLGARILQLNAAAEG